MGFLEDAKQNVKNALHSGNAESTDNNEETKESDPDDPSTQSSLERSGDEAGDAGRNGDSLRSNDAHDGVGPAVDPDHGWDALTDDRVAVVEPVIGAADPTGSATPAATKSTTEAGGADHSRE